MFRDYGNSSKLLNDEEVEQHSQGKIHQSFPCWRRECQIGHKSVTGTTCEEDRRSVLLSHPSKIEPIRFTCLWWSEDDGRWKTNQLNTQREVSLLLVKSTKKSKIIHTRLPVFRVSINQEYADLWRERTSTIIITLQQTTNVAPPQPTTTSNFPPHLHRLGKCSISSPQRDVEILASMVSTSAAHSCCGCIHLGH